jgi:CheY-like chemotaxis protein
LANEIRFFSDGKSILDFLCDPGERSLAPKDTQFLLLLDIRMPKIDGTEVLRRVKSDDRLRKIPCVMLTTTDDPREIEKCRRLGCDGYVVKPLGAEEFLETVRRLGLCLSLVKAPAANQEEGHVGGSGR